MKRLLTIFLAFILLSCEKKTDWNLTVSDPFLVADCIITNELKNHELQLYWSSVELNQPPVGFSGAMVELNDGNSTIPFIEDPAYPGRYVSLLPFLASAGKLYRLVISWQGQSDTAYAAMSGVSPMDEIQIEASEGYFHYKYNQATPAYMLEIYYDWSGNGEYCEEYGACVAAEVFYSLNNIDVGKIFAPDKQIIRFPHNTWIIRKKYSLNEDHQEFIRSLLLETEWRGGFFDTEQGNVPTNFSHGVRGWFAACSVVSDTTVFE